MQLNKTVEWYTTESSLSEPKSVNQASASWQVTQVNLRQAPHLSCLSNLQRKEPPTAPVNR
eukprot:scaffold248466_cov35-Prasinocladus_malaysianus.AAC.1